MLEENQTPEEGTEQGAINPGEETLKENGGEGVAENTSNGEVSQPREEEIDYKKKFIESSKEAQILNEKVKQLNKKVGEVSKRETPTEEELKGIYPNWDIDYSPAEQEILKKNLILERRVNNLHQTISQIEEEKGWGKSLDNFIEKTKILDKYSGLKGKKEEFRKFCQKPTHKGIDFEVLAKAFLYETPSKPKQDIKKGQLVERGSGGPKTPQKSKGYTPEDLATLRKTDYKKYKKVISQGAEIEMEE